MDKDWRVPFRKFEVAYEQVERAFKKPTIAEDDRDFVAREVKEMIEKGWGALALFLAKNGGISEGNTLMENVSERVNRQAKLRTALNQAKEIEVECDAEKMREQQWEIREVVFPAFRDLRHYLIERI